MFRFLLILAVSISEIRGQVSVTGKCPDFSVQQNFDVNKYIGKWYEYASYPNSYEVKEKCVKEVSTLLPDGTLKLIGSFIKKTTGKSDSVVGTAKFSGKNTEAKLHVDYVVKGGNLGGPLWVLETDYDSYAIIWSCVETEVDQKPNSSTFVWLLTRARSPSADLVTKMHGVLDKFKISKDKLEIANQENCTE